MASTISAGTTAGTAIAIAGDTTGNLAFQTNGTTTAMTIDTSQNVGIGTSSPPSKLSVKQSANSTTGGLQLIRSDNSNYTAIYMGGDDLYLQNTAAGGQIFYTSNAERMRIDSSGNVFVGGTTQNTATAPVYSGTTAKVWCSWGSTTGGATIQSSFNVSSVTRTATGTFTVAFTNALVDTNYAMVVSSCQTVGSSNLGVISYSAASSNYKTTGQVIVFNTSGPGTADNPQNAIAIFR